MQALVGFILAMSVTMVLMPLLMRWAAPLHILDMPAGRKVHMTPVPRVGGIAMAGGIFTALLLGARDFAPLAALLTGIAILLCVGIWDDRRSLGAAPKFAGQAMAALVVILWGGVSIVSLTFSDRIELPPWIALPLTFFFLLGGTNAFNLADGLDGLAGGMAVLCFCGTALLAYTVDNLAIAGIAVVFAGTVIGFLRYNTHPARVFMGDSGSLVLGFAAAVLALLLTQDPQVPLSTALPLLLMGMPIIDTVTVMTERLLAKRSPFKADRRHLHHRLLAIGFEHRQAVIIFYGLQTALFVAAWFLRFATDTVVVLVFGVFVVLLVGTLHMAEKFHAMRAAVVPAGAARPQKDSARAESLQLRDAAAYLLGATLLACAAWALLLGAVAGRDLMWLALALALLLAVSATLRWNRPDIGWSEKIALYSGATLAIYLGKCSLPEQLHPMPIEYVVFACMAFATVTIVRGSGDRLFKLTPLDMLVLVVVLIVPNLPDSFANSPALGSGLVELVLLCYAIEALSFSSLQTIRWLRGIALVFLVAIAMRPLL